jgi:GH35 family endo-1,4-beta-xylanase
MERITDCVTTFAGKIDFWDVVNEAAAFERANMTGKKLTAAIKALGRSEFVGQAFATARRANPKAVLLINDYEVGERYEQVIRELVDENGRRLYDVIGIQSHMHTGAWPLTKVWTVCERFAKFGVPLHFTELTVLSGAAKTDDDWFTARSGWTTTPEGERAQADYVEKLYRVLFSHASVEAITWWDFSDYHAWQGAPAGLLRKDQSPKPAYERLLKLIKGAWWTHETGASRADGTATFRVFRGRHRVTAQGADGARATAEITAARGEPNRVILRMGKVQ